MTTAAIAMEGAGGGPYPATFDVQYPEKLSRLLIFVKSLLAIPHIIVLYLLLIALYAVEFIVFFAVLITGSYPRGLFKFAVGVNRWLLNVNAYTNLLRDEYPPFSMEAGQYAVAYDVQYPEKLNRWLVLVKWLLIIPNLIVYLFVAIAASVTTFIAWWAILFTGKYPRGLFDFAVGAQRWGVRIGAYVTFMTDQYPPFSLKP